jgi:hypothetical protein
MTLQRSDGPGVGHGGRTRIYLGHPGMSVRPAGNGHATKRYFATPQPAPMPRVQFVAAPPARAKVAAIYKRH